MTRKNKEIPENTITSFDWKNFDMDSFFKETDSVGEILRKLEDADNRGNNAVIRNDTEGL